MIVEAVEGPVDPEQAFRALHGDDPVAVWLDSARVEPGLSRYSYLGSPGPTGEVLRYDVGRGHVEVSAGGRRHREAGTILDALARRVAGPRPAPGAGHGLPFALVDGWVGYLGYELKGDLGATNRHVSPWPDAVWVRCERLLVLDHLTDRAWLVAHGEDAASWVATARARLAALQDVGPRQPGTGGPAAPPVSSYAGLVRPEATYRADVEACLEALRRGESWELCLTDAVVVDAPGDPFDAYCRLRALNPAPHAAYLRLDGLHVLSASPETCLRVGTDGEVVARPIKGTTARRADPAEDAATAAALAADPKTRAENLIIVDLLRNDLSRVCEPGSVHAPDVMAVESYATVHQAVSTVCGRLAPGRGAMDAVAACFPPGSMTGAPRHRTMEILDALETRARGVYSGALGLVDRSGAVDLSVVIRTAVVADGRAHVGAGGAVVLDSDPVAETDEMLLKAASVLPALHPPA